MSSFRESRQKTNNDGPFLHLFVLFRKNRERSCLFCPCCHVWSLLSKKTTPTLPLLHRQAKKRADSCSGYRPEIPAERAAAGGEGASGGASRLDLGGKRRSLRGVVHHIRSMGGSTRYVMTSFLLIPRRYSCRDLRRLAQINAKLRTRRAPLLRERVRAPHDNSILIQIAASPFAATRGCRNIFAPTCLRFPSLATSSVPVRSSFVLFEETAEVSNWLR